MAITTAVCLKLMREEAPPAGQDAVRSAKRIKQLPRVFAATTLRMGDF